MQIRELWLARAIATIDIERRDLMAVALRLSRGTFGAVRYEELVEMPVDEMLDLIEEFNRMAKEQPNAETG